MRRLNLRRLEQEQERALLALERLEWWNGREWRPHGTFPTREESGTYRTAIDRLGDILAQITGTNDWQAFKRFGQAANALRKHDARKDDSHDAWLTLRARFGSRLDGPITKALLADCAEELKRGRYTTRSGRPWKCEGIKSLLRRKRL